MRIAHLITTLGVGGAEKHLLMLVAGQLQRGHEVSVGYLKGAGELAGAFAELGVEVHAPRTAQGGVRALAGECGGLVRWLAGQRPDVLHSHLLKADALAALAARRAGVQLLVSSKHNDERALLRWPVSVAHGLLARRVALTIALSDHVARFTARHGRVPVARIRRVYYGVDPAALAPRRSRAQVRRELGLDEAARVLVCVGRLAPQKDHPTLLAALAELPSDVVLLIVGGDPFGDGEARLRAQAERLGLGGRARFLGIRHDVADLLAASELFVLPSLWEGLGLVFLEAMAVGLAVVATRVSAIPEVVEEGVTGWLVEPGAPAALAAALRAALDDEAERARRGAAGRVRLEQRFGLARMVDETLAVYEEARR